MIGLVFRAMTMGLLAIMQAMPAHVLVYGFSHTSYTSATHKNTYRGNHQWRSRNIWTGKEHKHACHGHGIS